MRKTRISSALSLSAVAALALSACASSDTGASSSSGSDSAASADKSVSIAITNVFSSLNVGTAEGNSDTNGIINQMTSRGFYTITDTFDIRHNEWFGTYSMTEEGDGIKVDYKVNDDQKWSTRATCSWPGQYSPATSTVKGKMASSTSTGPVKLPGWAAQRSPLSARTAAPSPSPTPRLLLTGKLPTMLLATAMALPPTLSLSWPA